MEIGSNALSAMNRMTISNAGRSGVSHVSSMERDLQTKNNKKMKQACSDFESILIKQMLDSMRKTVPKDSLIEGGMAEDIFTDMIYDEYAKKMSKTGDFGIKEILYKQLSQNGKIL